MTLENIVLVLSMLGASGVVGTIVGRYIRPKLTKFEELEQVRADRKEDREELAEIKGELRLLTDYVHVLREHIADEKGPPPPPFPEGLSQ